MSAIQFYAFAGASIMFFRKNRLKPLAQFMRRDTVKAVQLKDGTIHYFDEPVSLAEAAAVRSASSAREATSEEKQK